MSEREREKKKRGRGRNNRPRAKATSKKKKEKNTLALPLSSFSPLLFVPVILEAVDVLAHLLGSLFCARFQAVFCFFEKERREMMRSSLFPHQFPSIAPAFWLVFQARFSFLSPLPCDQAQPKRSPVDTKKNTTKEKAKANKKTRATLPVRQRKRSRRRPPPGTPRGPCPSSCRR